MIRGELTNLRALERTDAGVLHRWFNAFDGPRGSLISSLPISLAEVQRRIEEWLDEERSLARPVALVFEDLEGEAVGAILLSHFEPNHLALEISLMAAQPRVWDASYEQDALESLIDAAFDQWNLHRLSARTPVENERLARTYEACGFRRDIVLREAAYFDGGYHDVALYCLLRTDRDRDPEDGVA